MENIAFAKALEEDAEISGEASDDLVEAAGYWHQAGEHEREHAALRNAIEADDGHGLLDARASFADFLMKHGESQQADELFTTLLHEHSQREETYLCAAYAYRDAQRPAEALRWLNVGAQRLFPEPDRELARGDNGYELLLVRRDLRESMGLEADTFDELHKASVRRGDAVLDAIHEIQNGQSRLIVYWPEPEFERLRGQTELPADTHIAHRRSVEATALERSRTNVPFVLVAGNADEFLARAELPDQRGPDHPTRRNYPGYLLKSGRSIDWPPGRNESCWCGSGRKYKKCCGAAGFVTS